MVLMSWFWSASELVDQTELSLRDPVHTVKDRKIKSEKGEKSLCLYFKFLITIIYTSKLLAAPVIGQSQVI